ncbi:MAG TPA: hypothetical protein VIX90_17530 [Edaphobacter sp.]
MPNHITPEIEKMLESLTSIGQMTCADLCANVADDLDTLANLGDFPPKLRGHIRMITLTNLAAVRAELKRKKCPSC